MRSPPPGVAFVAACAALLLGALSGCASCPAGGRCGATASGDAAASPRADIVCTNETVTGSRIIERRCRRRSDVEEREKNDRAAAERLLIRSNTPVKEP